MTVTNSGGKLIATAFVKAQREFGPALKSSTNPHFKSRYADLAACVEAVIDALNNNGIGMMQKLYENATGVSVETVFLHESGETIECGVLHVPATKHDAQGYGSALTYARRYSLMAACGIAPEDDDGNAAVKPKVILKPEFNESAAADLISAIGECISLEQLETAFKAAYKYCVNNETYKVASIKAKDQMKSKLGA
jgi:hypothetical protein